MGVPPWHGLQCGGLGGVLGDRGLVEDINAGMGFRMSWLLGTGGCGGGLFPARASSGVEELDDTLSCECLAVLLLGLQAGDMRC